MDGKISKIILIRDVPFNQLNQHDYHRFGIEYLRKKGLDVEVWDISPYLRKNLIKQLDGDTTINYSGLRIFREKQEIIREISKLNDECLINCFIEYSYRTFFIFRTISRHKIKYSVFSMSCIPIPHPVQNGFTGRMVSLLKKGTSLKISEIIQHIINKILLKYFFLFGIAPVSIILLCGEKSIESPAYPINDTTKQLWTHSPDYDIYLQKNTGSIGYPEKTGVFLDDYLPHHPDFVYLGIKFPLSPENYYPKICNFFTRIESELDTKMVIAAHPRSDYDNLPDYFCGRTIIKGETARLVADSSFVTTHMSTSINFAVLYHKPIIFITTDDLEMMRSGKNITGLFIQAISSELGKTPINIDHTSIINWDKEMEINEEAYSRYKDYYIKKPGTPDKPIWEIFYGYIQKWH